MSGTSATLILCVALAAPASAGWAQSVTDVPQIAGRSAPQIVPESTPADSRAPVTQLSAVGQSSPAASQLTPESASAHPPAQVSKSPRNAQPPQPISRPSDGRTAAVEHVDGHDRCDPAAPAAKRSKRCNDVIEARASEYKAPQPPKLSPEQRLLLEQQLDAAGDDVADATRRLATAGDTGNFTETMGIASIVLGREEQKPEKPDKDKEQPTDAEVQAILNVLATTPTPEN